MTAEIKEQIAEDILLLMDLKDILEKYGISRSTFYRLRDDKTFKHIMREKRAMAWETTIDNAYALAEESIRMIMDTMRNKDVSPKVRMEAAAKIMSLVKEHNDEVEIITRIDNLQDQLEKGW